MKQKKIILILFILFILPLVGCQKNNLLTFKKNKPSISYYTNKIISGFNSKSCEVQLLSTDFYKTAKFTDGEILILRKFFKYLPTNNYLKKPLSEEHAPKYKMFINFEGDEKYVIDMYNETKVTVYPWDGVYEKDYLTMENTYTSYNLYYLCDYIMKNTI